jgi:hypothetical protein
MAVLLVGALAGAVVAQCDCEAQPVVGDAECYAGFYATNPIEFKLVVPGDYFFACPACPVPAIAGWRVEAADGTVVHEVTFAEPKGHYYVMTWNQKDTWGNPVPTGFYRLVIVTDGAGEVDHYVNIQERPCVAWPCWCGCWGCCPTLESVPCCVPFGMIYLEITNNPTPPNVMVRVRLSIVQSGSGMP